MKYISIQLLFSLALAVCSLALFSADTQAAAITVTTTADIVSTSDSVISLREAIAEASRLSDDDTINFALPNCSGVCTITLNGTDLTINAASQAGKLTITNATGANKLVISGNNRSRIFFLVYGADLTLDGVTITGGNGLGADYSSNNAGGAIYGNYGTKLTLINSAVTNSTATFGGGIYSYNYFNGSLTMINSTVSGNNASTGGGVYINYGNARISNSTISGNTAQSYGGGIYNDYSSTLNLTNVTITNNRSTNTICTDCGGGVFNYRNSGVSSVVNMVNTIVAGNTVANSASGPDFSGVVSSTSSNNIIGNNQLTTGISDGVNGNQVGTPSLPINPQLAQLANNGGATETHATLALSPATDRGNNCVLFAGSCGNGNPALADDQRGAGFPRQSGGVVDVGAVEVAQSLNSFDVSGTVFYGTSPAGGPQKYVPGVTMSATGASFVSTTTDSTGYYMLRNLIAGGRYIVTPSKTGQLNGITSFDATLILRYVASGGNERFTSNQLMAADTDKNGSVSAFDATQILRFVAAGRPGTVSGAAGDWRFVASSRNYSATNSFSGENYDAVLIGDINGDWSPFASLEGNEQNEQLQDDQFDSLRKPEDVRLTLHDYAISGSGSEIMVPVTFTNNSGKAISSFSFDIAFDPNVLQPIGDMVDFTGVLNSDAGCAIATDTTMPGRIGVAVSCPTLGIRAAETQLNLHFAVTGKARSKAYVSVPLNFSQKPIFEDTNGELLSSKVVSFARK
ncbi:MAG: cohesin domain-containing protein [Acidobacteriota bacterium]|nr:cohesin domain-containing protein [Acidobacteriota bacterium]